MTSALRNSLSLVQETPQLRTLLIPLNLYTLNDLHSVCSLSITRQPFLGKTLSKPTGWRC